MNVIIPKTVAPYQDMYLSDIPNMMNVEGKYLIDWFDVTNFITEDGEQEKEWEKTQNRSIIEYNPPIEQEEDTKERWKNIIIQWVKKYKTKFKTEEDFRDAFEDKINDLN